MIRGSIYMHDALQPAACSDGSAREIEMDGAAALY